MTSTTPTSPDSTTMDQGDRRYQEALIELLVTLPPLPDTWPPGAVQKALRAALHAADRTRPATASPAFDAARQGYTQTVTGVLLNTEATCQASGRYVTRGMLAIDGMTRTINTLQTTADEADTFKGGRAIVTGHMWHNEFVISTARPIPA